MATADDWQSVLDTSSPSLPKRVRDQGSGGGLELYGISGGNAGLAATNIELIHVYKSYISLSL